VVSTVDERATQLTILKVFCILLVCIGCLITTGCLSVTQAYIPGRYLTDGWYENQALRESSTQFLGLEKWASTTYEINGKYPASLMLKTQKTVVLLDEAELLKNVQHIITSSLPDTIRLDQNHTTHYIIYDGIDIRTTPSLSIKIIGEIWNCPSSSTSIMCIGIAYTTNSSNGILGENMASWTKIIEDPSGKIDDAFGSNGLIYNIRCH
jgi:hypothetical protein